MWRVLCRNCGRIASVYHPFISYNTHTHSSHLQLHIAHHHKNQPPPIPSLTLPTFFFSLQWIPPLSSVMTVSRSSPPLANLSMSNQPPLRLPILKMLNVSRENGVKSSILLSNTRNMLANALNLAIGLPVLPGTNGKMTSEQMTLPLATRAWRGNSLEMRTRVTWALILTSMFSFLCIYTLCRFRDAFFVLLSCGPCVRWLIQV